MNNNVLDQLQTRNVTVSLDNVLQNAKASSGGEKDLDFLKQLIESKLLVQSEYFIKRTILNFDEEYYNERYRKVHYESDRHYYCRVILQDEFKKLGFKTLPGVDAGNMSILRANSSYDIVTEDFSILIDIGLTPARNFFRGLTDLRVKSFLITTYFDDYMDDIVFSSFTRGNDSDYIDAVKKYEESSKTFIPNPQHTADNEMYYH